MHTTRPGPWRSLGRATVVLVPVAVLVGVVAVLARGSSGDLTEDPVALGGLPVHHGLLSDLGILVLAGGVAVCATAAAALRAAPGWRPRASLLGWCAIATTLVLLDDRLQLHERVLADAGLPEAATLGGLGLVVVGVLAWHRRAVAATDLTLLVVAVLGAALWVLLEGPGPDVYGRAYAASAAKLGAIVAWTAWLVLVAHDGIAAAIGAEGADTPSAGRLRHPA